MKNKSLILNAIFNIIYKLLNVFFPLISSAYLSRILLADGLGSIAYAQNIVSYFTMIAALGIPTYGIREIAKARSNKECLNKTFSELFIINFTSTSLCILIYYFIILDFSTFKNELVLHSVFGLLIWFNFINVDWFYQGEEEYVYIAIRSTIIKIISLVLLFIFVKEKNDYISYALINCLATGGNYILNLLNLRKRVNFTLKNLNIKKHFRPILILTICSISIELYSKIDITMLGQGIDKSVVGYYSNAQKIINMVLTIITAISSIFLPRLSYSYLNMRDKFNFLLNIALKIVLFFAIPAFLGVIVLSKDIIIVLFGISFLPASNTLIILAILLLIKGIGDIICYQVIISTGNEDKLVFSYMLGAVVNIVLNSFLIKYFSLNGAAIASVISELVVNGTLFIHSKNLVTLSMNKNYVFSLFVSNILLITGIYLFSLINVSSLIHIIVEVIIGLCIYLGVSYLTKNEITMLFVDKCTIYLNNRKKS